jgi:carnitine 3-dehydrogenase
VDGAWPFVTRLGLYPGADPGRLRFVSSVAEVASSAAFIQESSPEQLDLKRTLLLEIDANARPEVVIASSTSGLLPTLLQEGMRHPQRLVVGHPFNPVYLLPLVEVVGGKGTSPATLEKAMETYIDLDMHPLLVRNEIDGFLSDRLLEALWREILHLVNDGVATTGELDRAIVYGPGLRWSAMGTNLIYHLAGGEQGMRHMLEQFGPALEWPWTKLVAPPLTEELIDRMVAGTSEQADGRSIGELEQLRDGYLLSVMTALRASDIGAGEVLNRREARIMAAGATSRWSEKAPVPAPLDLYRCRVLPDWVDYNRHMTESAYLLAFGWATDALFRYIGIDEEYRVGGHSLYTVETHLNFEREVALGEPLHFTTQVLGADEKRVHIFHVMLHGDTGARLATTEQMLVHVDTAAGRSSPVLAGPSRALAAVLESHRVLAVPEHVGHRMSLL